MTEAWKSWEGEVVNGEFRLLRYLGGSGHGAVYLTERSDLADQKFAIKLVPAAPQSADIQLTRWGLASKLTHPHLLRLVQFGRCQLRGTPLLFVVMEYADEDLSQIIPHRPLTPAEVRDMLPPVLDALAYLHSKGYVHAHIKPANILAAADQLKISADGICRAGDSNGSPGGSNPYDAPEVSTGGISPASDVWSLGMTLVQVLTQRLPVWQRMDNAEPMFPHTLPAPFLDVARHSLRRDPDRRWSVADIAKRMLSTSPVGAVDAWPVPEPSSTPWHITAPTLAIALILVALLGAILAGLKLLDHRTEAQQSAVVASEPAPSPAPASSKAEPPAKTRDAAAHETPRAAAPTSPKPKPAPAPATPAQAPASSPVADRPRGSVAHQVLPEISQTARDTIQGTVRVVVKLHVDPSGSVASADFEAPGPSKFFSGKALDAAQKWKFQAPAVGGKSVASEWTLRFDFKSDATTVVPTQVAP